MILHLASLLFLTLKLLEVIDWSWWLVFAPSIVAFSFALLALVVCGLIAWWAHK